jgi:hypothetical protein
MKKTSLSSDVTLKDLMSVPGALVFEKSALMGTTGRKLNRPLAKFEVLYV